MTSLSTAEPIDIIGITAVKADYALLLYSIESDPEAAPEIILKLKTRIRDLKEASLFLKEAALFLQTFTSQVSGEISKVVIEKQNEITSLENNKTGVKARILPLLENIKKREKEITAIEKEIQETKKKLEEEERKRKEKRESSFFIWKKMKSWFYTAIEAIEKAIKSIKEFLGFSEGRKRNLEAEIKEIKDDIKGVERIVAKLQLEVERINAEVEKLKYLSASFLDLQDFFKVYTVFFNNVADFYANASVRSEAVNFGVENVEDILRVLSEDTLEVDMYIESKLERISLEEAMMHFDKTIQKFPQLIKTI